MFTYNGSYGIFEEYKKGSLKEGKLADIVILDDDILTVSKDQIRNIKVNVTIKSGEILYCNL